MDTLRLSKSVKRITVLQQDDSGAIIPVVVYERGGRKKKGMRGLRPLERAALTSAEAGDAATAAYVTRHKKSNRKKRDGWMRDLPNNVFRSAGKGFRKGSGALWLL